MSRPRQGRRHRGAIRGNDVGAAGRGPDRLRRRAPVPDRSERFTHIEQGQPLQSPKRDAEARAMTVLPDLYRRRLGRENEMWERNRALGGSRTADNLEDIQNTSQAASGVGGVMRAVANLQFGDAVAQPRHAWPHCARAKRPNARSDRAGADVERPGFSAASCDPAGNRPAAQPARDRRHASERRSGRFQLGQVEAQGPERGGQGGPA